jgi:hypothetical protein
MYQYKVLAILKVVDGDTVDARISLGFGLSGAFRFRLKDVDTPELYGRAASEQGRQARDFVDLWLKDRTLVAETYKGSEATVGLGDGAFGRWLADFIDRDSGERLSEALRSAGLAT